MSTPRRLIVAGSRTIKDREIVRQAMNTAWTLEGPFTVVSGDAKGVDSIAAHLAEQAGVRVDHYPADWTQHGKRAGYIRNVQMAENADALLAIHDGHSRGTQHMIDIAHERGLPVTVINVKVDT